MSFFKRLVLGAGILGLGAFTIAGLTSCGKKDNDVTTIYATTKGKPTPFITVDEQGNLGGRDIDIVREVFNRLPQYKLEIEVTDSALDKVATGLADFSVNNWGYNAQRAETYYYSYPYTKTRYVFVTQKGKSYSNFEEIADLGLKTEVSVGGAAANALETWNQQNPGKQIRFDYTETDILKEYQNLVDGIYDFSLHDLPVVKSYEDQYPDVFKDLEYTYIDDTNAANIVSATTSHLLFSKQTPNGDALRKEVSEVIKQIQADGTLATITAKYVNYTLDPDTKDFVYKN